MKFPLLIPPSNEKPSAGVFSPLLACNIRRVNCTRRAIHLYFPDGDCCDMSGAINLANILHPKVKAIVTYSGRSPDRIYHKIGNAWESLRC